MKRSKRRGLVPLAVGAVLILSALLLYCRNLQEDTQAGQEANLLLAQVQAQMPQGEETGVSSGGPEALQTPPEEEEPLPDPTLPEVEVEGYGYVGQLEIPALELNLPVMAEWDYARLKLAPCRHFGSSRSDDLVIAAHNYKSHFGNLKYLEGGETVYFTDMDGIKNEYQVTSVQTLAPTEVEQVQNSGHDLVLYTCTIGGKTRVTVFCDRPEGTTNPWLDAVTKQ